MDSVEHGCGIYQRFLFQPGKHFLESEIEIGELMAMDLDPVTGEYLFDQNRFSYMGDCVEYILNGKLEVLKQLHW